MPLRNEVYLSKFFRSRPFRIYMVMEVYLQKPRSGCFLIYTPSGGRCPLEMRYTNPSSLGHGLSENVWLWGLSAKSQEWLLSYSCTFRREMPFGNKIYLSKFPGSFRFIIYMVMEVQSGCLFFPAPSGGRCPLEMRYTFPSSLGQSLSEHMWFWGLPPKSQEGYFLIHAPSGGSRPLEISYTYLSSFGHGLSEYIWLYRSNSKILGVVAFSFNHLQEGDVLWK